MKIFAAPLQGYTDAPFRHYHAELYGGIDSYFTPFLRVEKQAPASRALRDIESPLNSNHRCVPQIIFADATEFELLTSVLIRAGHRHINLNMGCPFPPQVHKGRGAGFIRRIAEFEKIAARIRSMEGISFSLKMRPGIESANEWQDIAHLLDSTPFEHITIHPRISRQQYSGDLHMEVFPEIMKALHCPVIFNGDISTPDDVRGLTSSCPEIAGVMIGRGLLSRPSIAAEFNTGETWTETKRIQRLIELHEKLFSYYSTRLCGDSQLLSRMKSFWDYIQIQDKRILKKIAKSHTVGDYLALVRSLS